MGSEGNQHNSAAGAAGADMLGNTLSVLRFAVDNVREAAYLVDELGWFRYVNQEACRVLGYGRDELLEMGVPDIDADFPGTDWAELWSDLERHHSRVFERRHRTKDGHIIPVEISSTYFEYEGTPYALAFARDIADRKRTEQMLAEAETKYRCLVEESLVGIYVIQQDRIAYANACMAQTFGYVPEELTDRSIDDLIAPEDRALVRGNIRKRESGEVRSVRYVFHGLRKDGTIIDVEVLGTRTTYGGRPAVIGSLLDITERKRAEDAMKQARDAADAANRAKDQFLAVLSHELRTPLTPVLATVTHLESRSEVPPMFRADVEMIRRNVELEKQLIDDLLDFTRAMQGNVQLHCEVVDAHAVLQAALRTCQAQIQAKQITVSLSLQARDHHVLADSARLQQVFWNLLQNAAKFTLERGAIQLRSWNAYGRIQIQVQDTGIGIEPAMLPRIFDAFVQAEQTKARRFGGLGLGLTIAKNLIDLHQGHLTVFSAGANQGATFTVDLAVTTPLAASQTPAPRPTLAQGTRPERRVLLVEDTPDTLKILSRLLRSWGYQVVAAESVRAALEAARHERFDLLISDIGLPDGSGLEIMRELKQAYGLRGIALSGYGMEEDLEQSRAAGFEQHLIKPVTAKALEAAIGECILRD